MSKKHQDPEVTEAPDTEPAPPLTEWREYRIRKARVAVAFINSRLCRVQELGDGFLCIEVGDQDPNLTEDPWAVALDIAEKSAWAGRRVRRVTDATTGEDTYR